MGNNETTVQIYENLALIGVRYFSCFCSLGLLNLIKQKIRPEVGYMVGILAFSVGTIIAGIIRDGLLTAVETISGKFHH